MAEADKIAVFKNDMVCCCNGFIVSEGKACIHIFFSVDPIFKVVVLESHKSACKINASGSTGYENFAPASSENLFMCINKKMKHGCFIISVIVAVKNEIGESVHSKVYFFKFRKRNRNMRRNGAFCGSDEFFVMAYRKINVFFRFSVCHCRYREHSHCHYHSKEKR